MFLTNILWRICLSLANWTEVKQAEEGEGPWSRGNHMCVWQSLGLTRGAAGQLGTRKMGVVGLQERMAHLHV